MKNTPFTTLLLMSSMSTIMLYAVMQPPLIKEKNNSFVKDFNNKRQNRVMVRLHAGVKPNVVYNKLLKLNNSDIKLVKSFPLIQKGTEKKYILVLESKKISNSKLLAMIKKINEVERVEVSNEINLDTQHSKKHQVIKDLKDAVYIEPAIVPKVDFNIENIIDNGTNKDSNDTPEAWERANKTSSSYIPKTIADGIVVDGSKDIKIVPSNNNMGLPIK